MSKIFKDKFVSHLINYPSYITNNTLSLKHIKKLNKPFFVTLKLPQEKTKKKNYRFFGVSKF